MSWFDVGYYAGILTFLAYSLGIFYRNFREFLYEDVFDNTIYGESLQMLDDTYEEPIPNRIAGALVICFSTLFISFILFLIAFLLSYIYLFIVISTGIVFLLISNKKDSE